MPTVTLFTRARCHLCEAAREVIDDVREEHDFALEVFDIDADPALRARYHEDVPVVCVDGEQVAIHRIAHEALRARLIAAERG